jgi:hypothetical protein
MKTKLTLEELVRILDECVAVIIDGDGLCYPEVYDLTGEPDNEFAYFSWTNSDGICGGDTFTCKLIEECAETIEYDGSLITMRDSEDEVVTIQPLVKHTSTNIN